jgi:hypothetical protein
VNQVDRRSFLVKAGAGGAAAGALWVAPSVIGYNAAFAGASCLIHETLTWGTTSGAGNGSTVPYSLSYAAGGGMTLGIAKTNIGGGPTNAAGNLLVESLVAGGGGTFPGDGGVNTGSEFLQHFSAGATGVGQALTFTFSKPVYQLSFTLVNIDFRNGNWQDTVWITGAAFTAVPNPPAASPTNSFTGAGSAANPWVGSSTIGQGGVGAAAGNVTVTMVGPVSSFVLNFTTGASHGNTEHVGLLNLAWCR